MNAAKESPPAPSLRRVPFSIRLAPEFTNCLSAILPAYGDDLDRFDGLLFGIAESDFAVLRVFRLFPSNLAAGTQESFQTLLAQSRRDPQVAGLALVGWFSARNDIDLQPEDIAFHEKIFVRPNDIALMIKSEPASQMSFGAYCRTSDGILSEYQHRRAGIRISIASPVVSPLELPLETKVYPDFLLPSRQSEGVTEEGEAAAGWKDTLAWKTKKAFELLKTIKPEDTVESAASAPAFEGIESLQFDDPSSIVPSPQFGSSFATYGGAAPAPARIAQDKVETQPPVEKVKVKEDLPPDGESPRIVSIPKQAPPAPPLREAVLVRSEEPRPALSASERLARAIESSPHPEPSNTEPHAAPAVPTAVTATFTGQLSRFRPKTFRDLPWRMMAAIFAVAAGGTFGLIYMKTAHANGHLPGFLQVFWPSPSLNMKVSTAGDRFQLSWNRDTPAVRTAREAILDINDGPQHHQIHLGNAEVTNGSVLYLPNTDDVVFRLEVHGAGGQNAEESIRVVGTAKSAVLDVSRPPDASASEVAVYRPQVAAKKAKESPGISSAARSEETGHKDLVAANRVPSAMGKPVPVSPKPSASAPAAGAPAIARSEPPDHAAALAADSAAGDPNATKTVTGDAKPPVRDTADSSPQHIAAATPGTEPPPVLQTSTPQAPERIAPAQTAPVNSVPEQVPQVTDATHEQPGRTDAKPLVSYRPPRPVKQVLPKLGALPAGISAETIGEVRVVVKVDKSGHVVDARLIEGNKKIGSIVANASLAAAKQWVFEPASLHGETIASDHTILFQFRH